MRFFVSGGLFAVVLLGAASLWAQTVDVYMNVKHRVGGVDTFSREKFITIHSNHDNDDWQTGNVLPDLMTDFILTNDVYFGRNTGYVSWNLNNVIDEDPSRSGWPRVSGGYFNLEDRGLSARTAYNDKTWAHAYANRESTAIMGAQLHPFWPDGTLTSSNYTGAGWAFSQTDTIAEPFGTATGFYMGQFISNYYAHASNGHAGPPMPEYIEVVNEPEWEFWGWGPPDTAQELSAAEKLWKFHNSVAAQIKSINGEQVKVGGYCVAFPDHENSSFLEWEREWKAYIDNCGTHLDFYSIHLYDFNENESQGTGGGNTGGSKKVHRRGSNLEATLDMIEHYSHIALGEVKPFVVSEYGGRARNLESGVWSEHRDWQSIKSLSSMMMSFADRPHLMLKTIPFIMLKEEWANSEGTADGVHNWRLMRRQNEPASFTGDYVYTEMVKFYRLWSEVNGTRVDITTDDPDVQIDAYVDGDRAYVILNNLGKTAKTVNLNLVEANGNSVLSVLEKKLYWDGTGVALDETLHTGELSQVTLPHEGTVILRCTCANPVVIDETANEVKYYATTYYQPITANVTNSFQINGVVKGTFGKAVLRLGMGRDATRSKQPLVLVNGVEVTVTPDFMGHEGDDRSVFFGQLNIPVSYDLLQESNTVSVVYPDTGGHISSVALRAYEFSADILAGWIPIDHYAVNGGQMVFGFTNGPANGFFALLSKTDLMEPGWVTNQPVLETDATGAGGATNEMMASQAFYRLVEVDPPLPVVATFDWEESAGDWWNGYSYTETDNGCVLVAGGRAAVNDGGDGASGVNGFAFKAAYSADSADGTFAVKTEGVGQQFVVTSIDISAGTDSAPQGAAMVRGMLDGVEQWAIDPVENAGFRTYTGATSGSMAQRVDQILWSAPCDPDNRLLTWQNKIDNLVISVPRY